MTIPTIVDPTRRPEHPADLDQVVACFDQDRIARTLGTCGACAFALPPRWRGGDPRHVDLVPIATLLGWSAPPSVDALVFVGGGRGTSPAAGATAAGDTGGRVPGGVGDRDLPGVDVVVAIDRAGRLAGRVRIGDSVESRPPAGGRLFDALHRCLGLATAPPAESTARLLATLWLSAIAASAAGRGGPLTWPETVGCHPISVALAAEDPSVDDTALEEAIAAVPRIWTWEALREATDQHGTLDALCPAQLAGWMDEGMFSRWVTGSAVPFERVVPDASSAVTAEVRRRTGQLLARSGVPLRAFGS